MTSATTASPGAFPDALSDVFAQVGVRGVVTGGFAVHGPWTACESVARPFKLIALAAGTARFSVDGPGGPDGPVDLNAGDVVLLNHRTRLEVRGGLHDSGPPRELSAASFDAMGLAAADLSVDDVLVGGWIDVTPAGQELLRAALPGLVHVHASTPAAARLSSIVTQIVEEASSERLGSSFAIRQQGQLFLLEVLRAYLEQEEPPIGWLRLLADERLAPALRLMTTTPATRGGSPSSPARPACPARASPSGSGGSLELPLSPTCPTGGCSSRSAPCAIRTSASGISRPGSATGPRAPSAPPSSGRSENRRCTSDDASSRRSLAPDPRPRLGPTTPRPGLCPRSLWSVLSADEPQAGGVRADQALAWSARPDVGAT